MGADRNDRGDDSATGLPPPPDPPSTGLPPPPDPPVSGTGDYPGGQGWHEPSGPGDVPDPQGPGPEPSPPKKRRFGVAIAVGLVVFALFAFGDQLRGLFDDVDRDADGAITEGGQLAVTDLRVGDCFNDPGQVVQVDALETVPCSEPHDLEVFHEFELADADQLPAPDQLEEQVAAQCLPAFEAFVTIPYQDSTLDIWILEPTAESWRAGDRTVQCSVFDTSGATLTGTARGAAR